MNPSTDVRALVARERRHPLGRVLDSIEADISIIMSRLDGGTNLVSLGRVEVVSDGGQLGTSQVVREGLALGVGPGPGSGDPSLRTHSTVSFVHSSSSQRE